MSWKGVHLWVNVGCGDRPAPDPWTNMDLEPSTGAELVHDATEAWPFETGTLEKVYMGQVIEHLDHPGGVKAALGEARRCLRTGGVLAVVCPDFDALDEKKAPAWVRTNLEAGMCRWPGDEHRWQPTRGTVLEAVAEFFPTAHIIHPSTLHPPWPVTPPDPWDCCVVATCLYGD